MKKLKKNLAVLLSVTMLMSAVNPAAVSAAVTEDKVYSSVSGDEVSNNGISGNDISDKNSDTVSAGDGTENLLTDATIYTTVKVPAGNDRASFIVSGLNALENADFASFGQVVSGQVRSCDIVEQNELSAKFNAKLDMNYSESDIISYVDYVKYGEVKIRIEFIQAAWPKGDNMISMKPSEEYVFADGVKVKYYDATDVDAAHSYVSGNDIAGIFDKNFYPSDLLNMKNFSELGSHLRDTKKYSIHYNYVTLYDGKTINGKKDAGKIVAVYNAPAPDGFTDIGEKETYKLKNARNSYYQVNGVQQTFKGYKKCTVNSKGMASVEGEILPDLTAVGKSGAGCYVMLWDDAAVADEILNCYENIYVAPGKTSSVYMPNVFEKKAKVKAVKSSDGIISAKFVKARNLVTVKAKKSAVEGETYNITLLDTKYNMSKTVKVTVVSAARMTTMYDGLSLMTSSGARAISLDKGEKAGDTVQLVTLPGEAGVKYFTATVSDLNAKSAEMGKSQAKQIVKQSSAAKKLATVKNGKVKCKAAGQVYVYAYVMQKTTGSNVKLIISNPVAIDMGATCATFKLSGGYRLKYDNESTGYQTTKDYWYKFTVKPSLKKTTDVIAVRVVDMKGRVVLGGKNALTTKSAKGTVKANEYYLTQKAGEADKRVADDSVLVVATAPNGIQHWAKLLFTLK